VVGNATTHVVTTIGETYIYATDASPADGTITLRYRPAYTNVDGGLLPFVYSAKTGTATSHCTVVHSGLTGLVKDGAAVSSLTDNSTTGGSLYTHTINGWPQAYLAVTNDDGSNAATLVIKATRVPWAY